MNISIANAASRSPAPPPGVRPDAAATTSVAAPPDSATSSAGTTPATRAFQVDASRPPSASVDGIARPTGVAPRATGLADYAKVFGRVEEFHRTQDAKEKEFARRGLRADDPEVKAHREESLRSLFWLQSQVMQASLQFEMASKLVEHATSGTRTILQTQT